MLTVEKIGGTSMSALKDVINNIILYKKTGSELYNRIFVVSAFAGVTNKLLENKKTGEPGVYHEFANGLDFQSGLIQIREWLCKMNREFEFLGLNTTKADEYISKRLEQSEKYLVSLSDIMASGYVDPVNILQAAREILASVGEAHSAFTLSDILNNTGINASFIDLSGFNDHQALTIDERIQLAFKKIEFEKTICVATGYAKGTEGIMREFDRGYTEVTFSKIVLAVKAGEAVIHKEYHLSSADPGIVGIENCIPVGFTNYDVADQLADIGMEAIHPKASKPLEVNGVNLRIKNTFEPGHPGTLITREYVSPTKRVEMITGSDKLIIIDIYDPGMVGEVGTDLKIMQDFDKFSISYIFKATSANSISIAIWERDYQEQLIENLRKQYSSVKMQFVALVCVIGSNIDEPGFLSRIAGTLAGENINILAGGFAMRKINFQFIIERQDYKQAIIALSKAMFPVTREQ